jgi:Bacterial low temperature requirement A protein (LtrA)
MRERGEGLAEVRPIELFFDLVYTLAITQLTRQFVENLTLRGASETLLLLLAVSETWNYTSQRQQLFRPRRAARAADAGRGDAREPDRVSADTPPASSCLPHERHLAANMLVGRGRAELAALRSSGPRPAGMVRLRREGHDRRRA